MCYLSDIQVGDKREYSHPLFHAATASFLRIFTPIAWASEKPRLALSQAVAGSNIILREASLPPISCDAAPVKGTDVDKPRNLAKSVTVEWRIMIQFTASLCVFSKL